MTERLTIHPEQASPPVHEDAEHVKPTPEKEAQQSPATAENRIEKIRETLEQEARSGEEEQAGVAHLEDQELKGGTGAIGSELRKQQLYRTLKNLQQHLPLPQRALSRIVHQPVVDALSEVGGKTVARPSGILGGGICAFLGSLLFLYYAKHVGYGYNYLLFVVLFVGGFGIGLVLETLIWFLYHRTRRTQ